MKTPNEPVDIVDDNNRVLYLSTKSKAHQQGLLHRTIISELIDPDGNWILVKQAADKQDPGQFVSPVGGHIRAGESEIEALKREAEEEVGLTGTFIELPLAKSKSQNHHSPLAKEKSGGHKDPPSSVSSPLGKGRLALSHTEGSGGHKDPVSIVSSPLRKGRSGGVIHYHRVGQAIYNRHVIGRHENHFFIVYKIFTDQPIRLNHESISFTAMNPTQITQTLVSKPDIFGPAFQFVARTFFPELIPR
jgi:hypothetical protein